MRLLTCLRENDSQPRLAIGLTERAVDVADAALWLRRHGGPPFAALPEPPASLRAALADWDEALPRLRRLAESIAPRDLPALEVDGRPVAPLEAVVHHRPPVPDPPSFRDFYAFEQHVRTARANRGLEMVPEWYQFPVFYFSNTQALLGHGEPLVAPPYTEELDYELEAACVIGRRGRDIAVANAAAHIAGYTILNDWSARDVQRLEMRVGLGPAKGKDFATSVGPWLVTPDELAPRRAGNAFDLVMTARRNGRELSRGNLQEIHWSFEQMIARAALGAPLWPGDLLGSGTVGTGCILELRPERAGGWLRPGDLVELEIEGLGTLRTPIVAPATATQVTVATTATGAALAASTSAPATFSGAPPAPGEASPAAPPASAPGTPA
jgi:fumarylacetoacetate (FAA) hydrolase